MIISRVIVNKAVSCRSELALSCGWFLSQSVKYSEGQIKLFSLYVFTFSQTGPINSSCISR